MNHPADPIQAVTHPDPHAWYADLAARRPMCRDEQTETWVAASAAAVAEVLASPACRVRPAGEPVPSALVGTPAGEVFARLVRMSDGDGQRRMKDAVSLTLASALGDAAGRAAAELAPRVLAEMHGASPEARIDRLAATLPAMSVAAMLGVAHEDLPAVAAWTGDLARCFAPAAAAETVDRGSEAAGALLGVMHAALHGAESERGMLVHLARAARHEGRGVDDALANAVGFLTQAYDATAGLIAGTMLALARNGEARRMVAGDRAALASVVDEVARYDAPVQNTRRFVAHDAVVAGQQLRAGDTILVVLAAANHDAAVNPQPEHFDPARTFRRTYTFGAGVHACPGERVAKAVACAAVGALLASGVDPSRLSTSVAYRPSINSRIPLFSSATSVDVPAEERADAAMVAVIFEVQPAEGQRERYLDIAAALRPRLDGIDGFVSIERFESLSTPGKILSLSFWRSEQAVAEWRRLEAHRAAQHVGREEVFADYRLRVAHVVRDYGMTEREQAPPDSRAVHDGSAVDGKSASPETSTKVLDGGRSTLCKAGS